MPPASSASGPPVPSPAGDALPRAGQARSPGDPGDLIVLVVAVGFITTSGPIIVACTAPALAIAFYRCFLGAGATGAWLAIRERRFAAGVTARQWRLSALAGVLLAAHFATWVPSLRFTTVASSTALVATQPAWAAVIARISGTAIPRRVWFGIGVALVGILVLTGVDFALDPRSLIGDGLALVGAILAAAYVSVGERVRPGLDTGPYTFVVYGVSALALLGVVLVAGASLGPYSARDWWLIIALTVLAQLLGHTLVNRSLRTVTATVTSLAILLEPIGATILAAVWLGQIPPWQVIPALALVLGGMVIVVRTPRIPEELHLPEQP